MDIPENKYLGKLCKRGHIWNGTGKSLRFKSSKSCIICDMERQQLSKYKKYQKNYRNQPKNKKREKEYSKKYFQNHINEIKKYRKIHSKEIKEYNKKYNKKYFETHQEKIKKYQKEYFKIHHEERKKYKNSWQKNRCKTNLKYRLSQNMSIAINCSLRGNKNGRHWEDLVNYSLQDLKKHLEFLFKEGMTWENYGYWHIDHIIPISVFNFSDPSHIDFQRCWSLDNLQPL